MSQEPVVAPFDPIERPDRLPTKAVSQDNRVHNRSLVLRALYSDGAMSRSDLARRTGLTRPTVSALVADLLDEGLVTELGLRTEPRIGKPATMVEFNPAGVCVIAIDLSGDDVAVGAVISPRGDILRRVEAPFAGLQGDAAYGVVVNVAATLIKQAPHRVLGIGVGSPGLIDDAGVVRYGSLRRWSNVPLAHDLAEHFHLPAHVGNDINMEALGALHFRGIDVRDLLIISIEHSVGMGVIVGGKVVEGEHFAAGEIGHVTASEDGATCVCGRPGCLEVFVSAARKATQSHYISAERRTAAITAAGAAIGKVVAPIATALNLSKVIIAGPSTLVTDDLVSATLDTIADRTIPIINTSVEVIALADDRDLILLGAASRVLAKELGIL